MTMKKILAGVIASATMMSLSASAFAVAAPDNTKPVTKPGETEYEAAVGMLSVELDVELPGQMKAFLNPYSAEVAVNEDATPANIKKMKTGVISWGYEIKNNTKDFGILIDANNVTGTATGDVKFVTAAPADGGKEVKMSLTYSKDIAAFAALTDAVATGATDGTQKDAGVMVATTAASQAKFGYVAAKGSATTAPTGIVGFVGTISEQGSTASGKTTNWTEDDAFSVSYVLKISPAAATATAAFA